MPTDSDRQAACERIATAMGWKKLSPRDIRWRQLEDDEHATRLRWANPVDVAFVSPPDFFADPVAADALMRWLDDNGYTWQLGNEREKSFKIQHYAAVEKDGATVVGYHQLSSSWSIALALAADAAIKEAAK
ncbi:hypothetical protein LCGC14_1063990 [marine sediment metagenome]|uniref:Uncharacterized protein n=1 Tax=marine sediment metagenome TaxID=412755 RepID=A0A0F9Q368_9ZZZZ